MNRTTWRLLVALLLMLALTAPEAGAHAGPLEHRTSAADPSVVKVGPKRYVAVATGPRVRRLVSRNGVRWRSIGPALSVRPSWARPGATVWAADLVHLQGRWLLYFAAPVRGMGATSRCIGVAVSPSSTGRFRPVGGRPLVCPPAANTPRAEDRVVDRHRSRPTYPTIGAIDPSVFLDRGRVFLLYKTDGKPSSIRLLRLRANGLHARGRSRSLLAADGVLENPVMVRHGRWIYLFMSSGDYSRCSYSTVWRRSHRITRWRKRAQHTLLARRDTGLCGPGGGDVVVDKRAVRLYFHGWTCGGARPCGEAFHNARPGAVRALYAARLRFGRRGVRVGSFVHRSAEHAKKRHHPKRRHHKHVGKHRTAKHQAKKHHAKKHHGKRHATKHRAKKHHRQTRHPQRR